MDSTARFVYIATAEPLGAIDVLGKYNYQFQAGDTVTTDDIGAALNTMVSENGDSALIDIMELHPDKGLLLELFAPPVVTPAKCIVTPTVPVAAAPVSTENKVQNFLSNNPTNALLLGIGVILAIVVIKS